MSIYLQSKMTLLMEYYNFKYYFNKGDAQLKNILEFWYVKKIIITTHYTFRNENDNLVFFFNHAFDANRKGQYQTKYGNKVLDICWHKFS